MSQSRIRIARPNHVHNAYGWALQQAYRVFPALRDPSIATTRDAEVWEKINRDAKLAHAVRQRLHTVSGVNLRVEPGVVTGENQEIHDTAARVGEDLLGQIKKMPNARLQLAKVVFHGTAYQYIEGRRKVLDIAGLGLREWWVPTKLRHVDHRRIRRVADREGGSGRIRGVFLEMFSLNSSTWNRIDDRSPWIEARYDDEESRLGYGHGIIDALYHYFWIKEIVLKEGLQGLERWAQGILAAKVKNLRQSSAEKPTSEMAKAWLKVLEVHRSQNAVVLDADDEISVHDTTGTGHKLVTDFLRYLDEAATQLILGSVLPTGGTQETGSLARAQVEEDSSEALVQYDRTIQDEALTDDLIRHVWTMNRTTLAAVGLADAATPKVLTIQEKKRDPKEAAETAKIALDSGAAIRTDEYYAAINFSVPQEGDDVIEPGFAAQQAALLAPDIGPGGEGPGGPEPQGGQDAQDDEEEEEDDDAQMRYAPPLLIDDPMTQNRPWLIRGRKYQHAPS